MQKRSNVFKWQVISNVSVSSKNISEHTNCLRDCYLKVQQLYFTETEKNESLLHSAMEKDKKGQEGRRKVIIKGKGCSGTFDKWTFDAYM